MKLQNLEFNLILINAIINKNFITFKVVNNIIIFYKILTNKFIIKGEIILNPFNIPLYMHYQYSKISNVVVFAQCF